MKDLLKAFGEDDPPPDRQKALTPEMLKDLQSWAPSMGEAATHTGDLIEGGFFFAMRGCEFVEVPKRGRTKILILDGLVFRDRGGRVLNHDNKNLETHSRWVTVTYRDQKSGKKLDRRTQRATFDKICPVRAWARVVQRVRRTIPNADGETPVCKIGFADGATTTIRAEDVVSLLRQSCRIFGPVKGYSMHESELGTRSIRSGAAMALFLMDHSVEKIMILGRWSSDAFMVYIRPQVLEWTNIMSRDMARAGNFRDLNHGWNHKPQPDTSVIGRLSVFPKFNLGRY